MSVVVGLNACGDPTSLKANLTTSVDSLFVYALSGTPPTYPSGLSLVGRQPVRVDGFASFDVALDIDAAGKAVIYPVKLVVASPGGSRPVGMIKVQGTFEQVVEAPKSGFEADSAISMAPGEVVVVQSAHNTSGDLSVLHQSEYLREDSVNLASRTLFLRLGLDPNCGFRSFAAGIPTG